MLVTFEKIEDISSKMVQFYTVKLGNQELTEFELFDAKDFPNHYEELQIIYNVINQMQFNGAKQHYFKFEQNAEALPIVPSYLKDANKEDFGLRLYCKRVSDEILILFNGDIKTVSGRAIDCPQVRQHFTRALKIGMQIDKAILERDIDLNDKNPFINFEIDI